MVDIDPWGSMGLSKGSINTWGSKRGRPGILSNFKYKRYSKRGRDTEQQFHRAWYAVSLTNVYGNGLSRDVAAAPQTPQLGGPRPTLGAQVSLKLLFGYVTIFSSAGLFTTDLNCRKKLACDIISECYAILSRRI